MGIKKGLFYYAYITVLGSCQLVIKALKQQLKILRL